MLELFPLQEGWPFSCWLIQLRATEVEEVGHFVRVGIEAGLLSDCLLKVRTKVIQQALADEVDFPVGICGPDLCRNGVDDQADAFFPLVTSMIAPTNSTPPPSLGSGWATARRCLTAPPGAYRDQVADQAGVAEVQ